MFRLLRPPTSDFDAQHDQAWFGTCALPVDVLSTTPPRQSDHLYVWNRWRSRRWHCAPPKSRPSTIISSLRIHHGWLDQVQVSDHRVPAYRKNPRHSILQGPPSTRRDSCARCSVVATRVKWTATPTGTCSQGEGKTKSRRTTLNNWGGIFVSLLVGHVDSVNPAPDSLGPDHGLDPTREAASCCQPSLQHPGSKYSGSRDAGLTPCARTCHVGGSKPHTPVNSLAAEAAASKHDVRRTPSNSSTIN